MSNRKPVLSKKSPYYIPKHRYYELKHFCLQYPDWQRQIGSLSYESSVQSFTLPNHIDTSRPVEEKAMRLAVYYDNCLLVESCAEQTDFSLSPWIFEGVTRDRTYEYLSTMLSIPCCRDTYYDRYRKFFWILDKYRN